MVDLYEGHETHSVFVLTQCLLTVVVEEMKASEFLSAGKNTIRNKKNKRKEDDVCVFGLCVSVCTCEAHIFLAVGRFFRVVEL